jgi:hypothetical protein
VHTLHGTRANLAGGSLLIHGMRLAAPLEEGHMCNSTLLQSFVSGGRALAIVVLASMFLACPVPPERRPPPQDNPRFPDPSYATLASVVGDAGTIGQAGKSSAR